MITVPHVSTLRRPDSRPLFRATSILVFLLPITLPIVGNLEGTALINVRVYHPLVIAAAGLLLLRQLHRGTFQVSDPRLVVLFGFYLAANLASLLSAYQPMHGVRALVKLLSTQLPLFYVVIASVRTRHHVDRLLALLGAAGALEMLAGVVQITLPALTGVSWHPHAALGEQRPSGTFTEYVWYGIYLSSVFSFLLPWVFGTAGVSLPQRRTLRRAALFTLSGVLISGNRAALYVVSVSVFAYTALVWSRRRLNPVKVTLTLAAFLGAATVAGAVAFPTLLSWSFQRLPFGGESTSQRIAEARLALEEWKGSPFTGRGVGNWGGILSVHGPAYAAQFGPGPGRARYAAGLVGGGGANLLLNTLFEAGVFGLAALCVLLGHFGARVVSAFRRAGADPWAARASQSCVLLLLALLVHVQMNVFYLTDVAWFMLGLVYASSRVARIRSSWTSSLSFPVLRPTAATEFCSPSPRGSVSAVIASRS